MTLKSICIAVLLPSIALAGEPSADALHLNGTTDSASGSFDIPFTEFTVEAWVNVTSLTISSISSGGSVATYGRGGQQSLSFWLTPNQPGVAEVFSPRLQINFNNGTSRITGLIDPPLPYNQWAHVAVTYDNQTARIYANGDLVEEQVWNTTMNPLSGGQLVLGREFPGNSEWMGGELDEVRIWSRVLSQSEIQTRMDTTLCVNLLDEPDDLFAYYPMDDDTALITDQSTHGRDLSLNSTASLVNSSSPVAFSTACEPCNLADLAQGYSDLDFLDISSFINQRPDLNGDTSFDFLDVSLFVNAFSKGCP